MATVLDLAHMAEDVYHDKAGASGSTLPSHITRVSNGTSLTNGFFAAVYQVGNTTVLTYRGTDATSAMDWMHNAQTHSIGAAQFKSALDFAVNEIIGSKLAPEKVLITGHSLGGGLAKYVAHNLAANDYVVPAAISFNGPGLTAGAIERGIFKLAKFVSPGIGHVAEFAHGAMQRDDVPKQGATGSKIACVNIDGDKVSQIGDSAGKIYKIKAPPMPKSEDDDEGGIGDMIYNAAKVAIPAVAVMDLGFKAGGAMADAASQELYYHMMSTVVAALKSNPLGGRAASMVV